MTTAGWILLALGAVGAAYSIYVGLHFYRHRERRRVLRRAARGDNAQGDADRRNVSDRRRS